MNHDDEPDFEGFLALQMKDKGLSIKKLSEATGIAPAHIENMLRGEFEGLPSAPYFRGYLMRIGKTLGFDGEEWWGRLRDGGAVRNSGPLDILPRNRFVKKKVPGWLWFAVAAGILLVIYLAVALPQILGRPSLAVTYPPSNPFVASSTTLTFQGTVRNAQTLYLSSGGAASGAGGAVASSGEEIPVAPDGTWQKTVLLQNGLNTFDIAAKKFLGGQTLIVEQVLYESPSAATAAPSGTAATSTF